MGLDLRTSCREIPPKQPLRVVAMYGHFLLAGAGKVMHLAPNTISQSMQSIHVQLDFRWRKSAFTLLEMLVVIAIISILMTAGTIGLSGMGGKGVSSGVAITESLFDEARTTAVSRNIRACVLLAKTLPNKPDHDLRRLVVAYEEVDANGLPTSTPDQEPKWVLSSRGAVLPDQVYFSEKFSKKNHAVGSEAITEMTDSRIKDVKAEFKGTYFIYEFNDQGICKTPGASFIIGNGSRNTGQAATAHPPRVMAAGKRDFGGFIIWRNGRTSVFRSPEQMGAALKSLKSGDKF
jgi:prepilin-type N-terminal cleavage/methylation domain-containing protein